MLRLTPEHRYSIYVQEGPWRHDAGCFSIFPAHLRLIHVELRGHCFHLPSLFLETCLVHRQLLRNLGPRLLSYDSRNRVQSRIDIGEWVATGVVEVQA